MSETRTVLAGALLVAVSAAAMVASTAPDAGVPPILVGIGDRGRPV